MAPKKAASGKQIGTDEARSPKRFKLPGARVPLTSPAGKKQGQGKKSRFWNKACRYSKQGADGQQVGELTGNWLACFIPANKEDNARAKEGINDVGLRESARWCEELKCFIIRSQSPDHSEHMFNVFKLMFPDVEPAVFERPVWTKALPVVHVANVKEISVQGTQTAAVILTGDLWPITPALKAMLPFTWSRELHALVHTFPIGDDAPEIETKDLHELYGWTFTVETYDELDLDGQH